MVTKAVIKIDADTSGAVSSINKLGISLKAVAGLAAGFFAAKGVINLISSVTEAANIQEDAVNALNTSLKISGQFSEEASKSFQEYASSIQQVTTVGDEAILQNAALIQSLGQLSNETLKSATKAAIDLSAALGMDLATASNLVGKAAAGNISSLSRYGIILKSTGDKALDFSNALQKIEAQFGGAAKAKVNTFSGATQQLSNTWGDLLEELGFFITKNPIVIDSVKQLTGFILDLSTTITDNRGGILKSFSKGFLDAIDTMLAVIPVFAQGLKIGFIGAINGAKIAILSLFATIKIANTEIIPLVQSSVTLGLIWEKLKNRFTDNSDAVEGATNRIIALQKALNKNRRSADLTIESISKLKDEIKVSFSSDLIAPEIQTKINGLRASIGSLSASIKSMPKEKAVDIAVNLDKGDTSGFFGGFFDDFTKWFGDTWDNLTPQLQNAGKQFGSGFFDTVIQGTEQTKAIQQEIRDIEEKQAKAKAENDLEFQRKLNEAKAADDKQKQNELYEEKRKEEKDLADQRIDAEKRRQKIADDAGVKTVSQLGKSIGDIFGDGVGDIVAGILTLFEDPEAFDAFINGLFEAIPGFVGAIGDNLDDILTSFFHSLPDLTKNLGTSTIQLIEGIIGTLARNIAESLNEAFDIIGDWFKKTFSSEKLAKWITDLGTFFETLGDRFLGAFEGFFSEIGKAGSEFIENIKEAAGAFAEKVKENLGGGENPFTIGGSVGAAGESIKRGFNKAFGFADGGVVPGGFPNDTFPARLTSGEVVLNQQQQQALGQSNEQTQSLLGQILGAVTAPVQVSTSVSVNQQTFADIILELNRDNRRLTV